MERSRWEPNGLSCRWKFSNEKRTEHGKSFVELGLRPNSRPSRLLPEELRRIFHSRLDWSTFYRLLLFVVINSCKTFWMMNEAKKNWSRRSAFWFLFLKIHQNFDLLRFCLNLQQISRNFCTTLRTQNKKSIRNALRLKLGQLWLKFLNRYKANFQFYSKSST